MGIFSSAPSLLKWSGVAALSFMALQGQCQSSVNSTLKPEATARIIQVADQAWASTSVNVLAGVHQTLFTESIHQYTAFYNATGELVLGKRRLGEDTWQLQPTGFKGNVKDAHNHISLVVDGDGYLHVSWDHHNNKLRYARSKTAGSLELDAPSSMLGINEDKVTYPAFFRLNTGDLLFQYRDGGSGNGQLVMNRYNTKAKQWERVQSRLLDGQGKRSAYWDMTVDKQGKLHLAWIWRETPDVASNHDLGYAISTDEGKTWQDADGKAYTLPITADNSQYAKKIPQKSNLMNPPVISTDDKGKPYITSYWSASANETPSFQILYRNNNQWQTIQGPKSTIPFTLEGTSTKHPPISRPLVQIESTWRGTWLYLIYRDDGRGQRIVASTYDFKSQEWTDSFLTSTDSAVGAWEPSYDPVQWKRLGQIQMLVQQVQQPDGNDASSASSASPINLLMWNPNWERHQALHPSPQQPIPANINTKLRKKQIAELAKNSANWQWNNLPTDMRNYHPRAWTLAPLYIGSLAAANKIPKTDLISKVKAAGEAQGWNAHERLYDADDYCVIQPWISLYLMEKDPKMLAPSKAWLDSILAAPAGTSLDWGSDHVNHRWSWSDALYMGPMSWLLAYKATGDERYLNFMNSEWWATTERLYRSEIGLYFRDESYLDMRERNGKTIHWARGTGWSFAGLAQILEIFPKNHPDYPKYIQQYKEMASAYVKSQQPDGLWRPGILDPQTHTARETSGSSFAVFGLAWGLNHKVLDKKTYLPAVVRGWNSLSASVTPEGKLEDVQPIGAAPHGFDPHNSEPFATGAFLMAASEVYGLAN